MSGYFESKINDELAKLNQTISDAIIGNTYEFSTKILTPEEIEAYCADMYTKLWEPVSITPIRRKSKLGNDVHQILATFRRTLGNAKIAQPPSCTHCTHFQKINACTAYCSKNMAAFMDRGRACEQFISKS